MEQELNSIDRAIETCQNIIASHRRSNLYLINAIILTLLGFFAYFIFIYQDSRYSYKEKITELGNKYEASRRMVDTLWKIIPDSLKKKEYVFSPVFNDEISNSPEKSSESNTGLISYGIFVFGIVVISILTALYRLHLKEISKAQHNLTAFCRIRVAAHNTSAGFSTEVRASLTTNAFYTETDSGLLRKRLESPVPGHPSSDIVTALLNKILDNVEVKPKN